MNRYREQMRPRRGEDPVATNASLTATVPGREPHRAWRLIAARATALWLATRAIYVLITYFSLLVTASPAAPGTPSARGLYQGWQRFDANWYLAISATGYDAPVRAAFFPLFPALVSATTAVIGDANRLLAGMLVSNLAALAAFIGIGLLAAHEDDVAAASAAIRMLAAYPLGLFMVAAYADGLFLACATFALLCARQGKWFAAAGCAFLAAGTRPTGVILILPLAWEYGRQHQWWRGTECRLRGPGPLAEAAVLLLAVPLALTAYASFLWWRFGDPLAFVHVQALAWHRDPIPLWQAIRVELHALVAAPLWSPVAARRWVDALPLLVIAAVTLACLANRRRLPVSFTLYLLGTLVVAVAAPKLNNGIPLAAAGRYLLAAVPIFLLLGRWSQRRPALDVLLVGGGFALQALYTAYFLTGGYLI